MAKIETVMIAMGRADGGVSIMSFVTKQFGSGDGPGWEREPSKENIDAEILRSGADCVSWRIVGKDEIPEDRTFRNAWKPDLSVDMPKAREIHKAKLRRDRGPKLAALDMEAMRADEIGDTVKKADVIVRKQILRDITVHPGIEAATTPEELKTIMI